MGRDTKAEGEGEGEMARRRGGRKKEGRGMEKVLRERGVGALRRRERDGRIGKSRSRDKVIDREMYVGGKE